jgi:transcriptional regulator NrdR family protein
MFINGKIDYQVISDFVTMKINSETLKQDIDQLTTEELQAVADFIAFLRFRQRRRSAFDVNQLAELMTEFSQEDQAFAEEDG